MFYIIGLNTANGAKYSATIYGLVETAKAYDFSCRKYLVYLMDVLSDLENKGKDTLMNRMPWSNELSDDVWLQNKNLHDEKD